MPTTSSTVPHPPTIDELIEFPQLTDAQISPDGAHVVYGVLTPDWKANEYVQQLWLVSTEQGDATSRQLTFASTSSYSPRWSPDGEWLAFLSKRAGDKHTQIYRMSPLGGEAERLTELESNVAQFAWSPSGDAIAFTALDPKNALEKQREERYGDFHIEDEDDRFSHLWLLQLADKSVEKLTGGRDFHVVDFEWRPEQNSDAGQIALAVWPSPRVADGEDERILLLMLRDRSTHSLTETGCGSPRWSPDGRQLAFERKEHPSFYTNNHICTATVESGANGASLAEQSCVSTGFDEVAHVQGWGHNGIYFFAMQPTSVHLFRLDPQAGETVRITQPDAEWPNDSDWFNGGCSFTRDFSRVALVGADSQHCNEIIVLPTNTQSTETQSTETQSEHGVNERPQRLTRFNERLQAWQLAPHEVIEWTSRDGTPIDGVLTKPLDFDPQKTYPLLVVIHGGPTGISTPARLSRYERNYYPIQQWAAKGALVLQPNYRGSGGYGAEFRALNVRNLGVGDAWDVLSGVDALIERGWVDTERMGVMGWSQGGYITAFLATSSDRFCAASMGAGISNWVTYYVNTDIHPFTRHYLGATPWEDMDIYQKTSPMSYIRQAQTPMLIQHGERDQRVPIPNAYEIYQGLQDVGVETRLVVYKGQPHGIGKPRLNRHVLQDNLDWFNRWVWGEETPPAPARPCYVAPACSADLLAHVYRAARRDDAALLVFAGSEGLVAPPAPEAVLPQALDPEDAAAVVQRVAQQLREHPWRKLVYFARKDQDDPQLQLYHGCLLLAAGTVGNVHVERRIEDIKTQ